LIQALRDILLDSHSLPFLFVGSGISSRYKSVKNWSGLLKHFSSLIDDSEYTYEKYLNKARQQLILQGIELTKNNLFTKIADLIEIDFNNKWFDDPTFAESRSKYKKEIEEGVTPFKLEVSNYFKETINNAIPSKYTKEVDLLKEIGKKSISGIITTNYDMFLESLFPDYNVYIGQEELLFSVTHGINEIYKIHGCCSNPSSIVINSSDYNNFSKKNAYLAAKLMTIFVEHPIIFLGYSLEDENIQGIIKSIVDCLSEDKLNQLRNRLIFVEWKEERTNIEIVPHSRDFGSGKIISLTKIETDSFEELFYTLLENKTRYSTKLIRKIKKDIYHLTLTSEPSANLVVLPITDEQIEKENIDVVIGFGLVEFGKQGYRGITAEQIFLDIVFDNYNFNHELLVKETLPTLLKQVAYSLPVFKYIRGFDQEQLPEELRQFKDYSFEGKFVTNTARKNREKYNFKNIDDVLRYEPNNLSRQVRFLQTLTEDQIEIQPLEEFLKKTLIQYPDLLAGRNCEAKSGIKKMIRVLDFLKYKQ